VASKCQIRPRYHSYLRRPSCDCREGLFFWPSCRITGRVGACPALETAPALGASNCVPVHSDPDHYLEPAPEHPLAIERHRSRIHHAREARILHHGGIYPIAVCP